MVKDVLHSEELDAGMVLHISVNQREQLSNLGVSGRFVCPLQRQPDELVDLQY